MKILQKYFPKLIVGALFLFCVISFCLVFVYMQLMRQTETGSMEAGPFVKIVPVKLSPSPFPLELKNEVDLQGPTYESPIYQDGLVLISSGKIKTPFELFISHDPNVNWYGIDANTGNIIWSKPVGKNYAQRCVSPEYLVVSSNPSPFDSTQSDPSLMVLEMLTGELVWQKEKIRTVICSDSSVILGESRGWIEAISIATGQEIWSGTTPTLGFSHWRIIYNPNTNQFFVRAATRPWDYYFIDAATGKLGKAISKTDIEPHVSSNNELFSDMLFIDSQRIFMNVWPDNGKDFVAVIDAQTGKVLHREDRYGLFISQVIAPDTIYAYTEEMGVIAVDKQTFELKWNYPRPQHVTDLTPTQAISSLITLNGFGYIIFSDGSLRAINLETGQEAGYWQPDSFNPPQRKAGLVASKDRLFVSFGDGKLYIFSSS